jgi:uncharacterized protein YjiS (DUF1127 family)
MRAIAFLSRSPFHASRMAALDKAIRAMAASACALVREWRRRSRSRRELALYSPEERSDLGFAADLDAEIAKPFWTK